MIMLYFLIILLSIGWLGVGITAVVFWRQNRAQRRQIAGLQQEAAALRREEARFQHMAASISDVIYVTAVLPDGRGQYQYLSPNIQTLCGYTVAELQADWGIWRRLVHPLDAALVDKQWQRLRAGHDSLIEYRIVRANGRVVWVRDDARVEQQADGLTIYGVFRDVTTRKDMEQILRRTKQRYQDLFANAPVMYALTQDVNGKPVIVECNDVFSQTLAYGRSELIGKNLLDFYTPQSRQKVEDEGGYQAALAGRYVNQERQFLTRDGRVVDVLLHARPGLNDDGSVIGTQVIYIDISDRKRAEEQLQVYMAELVRSNAELESFALVASHDLKEPLRKITAFGERLQTRAGDQLDERSLDYLERMQSAARRMQKLIDDLLAYATLSTRERPFAVVNMNEVVQEVLSDLEARLNEVNGQVQVGDLPALYADRTQMRQLMQNLISNALKFHRPDVPPQVQIEATPRPEAAVPAAEILVIDNGIGFAPEYAERIFDAFQRLNQRHEYTGSGIGLAVCRKIMERHQGKITAVSRPGEGATFILTFPLLPRREEEHNP